jgi:hypothetical protein
MAVIANITGNGDTLVNYNGGPRTLAFAGTFDSGTITLFAAFDGSSTYIACPDSSGSAISATANEINTLHLFGPATLKFTMSGSTSPDVDVHLV